MTDLVRAEALRLAHDGALPAYVYDLAELRNHARAIREALSPPELLYAAKANPEAPILETLAPYVDGVEVASGGELRHVRRVLPEAALHFGGPGKTDGELALGVGEARRVHVESPHELRRLAEAARRAGRPVEVLLRVNLPGDRQGAALAMSGPFGMDETLLGECLPLLDEGRWVRLRGLHAHLASGLDAVAMVAQSTQILAWARPWLAKAGVENPEINLGGGMGVDYADTARRFDWARYGSAVAALAEAGETLRIEPGRSVSVYCGWYVTTVLDVKVNHGRAYGVLAGGTHHLRTPAAKGHSQPFTVLRTGGAGPAVSDVPITLVGQLCTPKDVFARDMPVERLGAGDVVAFGMAGAYAWNISHHGFLMHPEPGFHYLGGPPR
jgi:diaminopimelate decarboxylase